MTLSSASDDASSAHLSIDDRGNIDTVWQRFDGSKYRVEAAQLRVGGTWTAAVTLSPSEANAQGPQITSGSQGLVRVVWTGQSYNSFLTRAHAQGGAWAATETIAATSFAGPPKVAVDPRGVSTIAWVDGSTLMATRQVPGQAWETPTDVQSYPVDGNLYTADFSMRLGIGGRVVIAWDQTYDYYRYFEFDSSVQVSERDPATGRWTTSYLSELNFDESVAGVGAHPTVTTDGSGNISVCWIDIRPPYDLQCQTRSPAGVWVDAYSRVDGPGYAADASAPTITSDAYGDATVLWINSTGSPRAPSNAVNSAVVDIAGPKLLSLAVPATVVKKATGTFSVAPKDTWSSVASTKWTFGDGATATGNAVKHAYAAAGSFSVSATSTDSVGNATKVTKTVIVK